MRKPESLTVNLLRPCGATGISKLNERNPQWRGDEVGKIALHNWVRRRLEKPGLCPNCKSEPPRDLANISQEYKRDLTDWKWLCRRCHMQEDGRMKNLVRFEKGAKLSEETREKLRKSSTGRKYPNRKKPSEETKRKIGLAGIGRKASEETKKKMAEARKRWWDRWYEARRTNGGEL